MARLAVAKVLAEVVGAEKVLVLTWPMPEGVPVMSTVPASMVVPWLMKARHSFTPKIMSDVESFCTCSPLRCMVSSSPEASPRMSWTREGVKGECGLGKSRVSAG